MSVKPGWYTDPADPTTQRYWDGDGWVGDPLPVGATPPEGPPPEAAAGSAGGAVEPDSAMPPVGPPPGYYPYPPYRLPPPTGAAPAPAPPAAPPPVSPPPPAPAEPPGDATAESTTTPSTYPPYPFPYYSPPGLSSGNPPPQHTGPQYTGPQYTGPQYPVPGYPYPVGYPYPPLAVAPQPHGLALAAPSARLLARLIDFGLVLILTLAVNGYLIWKFVEGYGELVRRYEANESLSDGPMGTYLWLIVLLTAALWGAYEIPQLASNGQTVGKRLVGIKVMRLESDQPLGFGRSFRRWWGLGGATLLWPCFGVGFLIQFVDCLFVVIDRPLSQALHDKRAATVVVRVGRGKTTGSDLPGGTK
jgi:uncharacterized RDD family membrane protein YckC